MAAKYKVIVSNLRKVEQQPILNIRISDSSRNRSKCWLFLSKECWRKSLNPFPAKINFVVSPRLTARKADSISCSNSQSKLKSLES